MRNYLLFNRYLVLIMVMFTLTVTMHNNALKVQQFQKTGFYNVFLTDIENDIEHGLKDFKPPKHSFINYETFFGNNTLVLPYLPLIANLKYYHSLQTPPEFYPDIFVPPQNIT